MTKRSKQISVPGCNRAVIRFQHSSAAVNIIVNKNRCESGGVVRKWMVCYDRVYMYSEEMSVDGLVLTRQGVFGLTIIVLASGVSSRGKSAVNPHILLTMYTRK